MKNWDPFISRPKIPLINKQIQKKQVKISPNPALNILAKFLHKCLVRNLKLHFNYLKLQQKKQEKFLKDIVSAINKNQQICKQLAWQNIKRFSCIKNTNKNLSRSFINLTKRIHQHVLGKAFKKILIYSSQKTNHQIANIINNRIQIIINIFKYLIKDRKVKAFYKLQSNQRKFKRLKNKLQLIAILNQKITVKVIREAFKRIMKKSISEIRNNQSDNQNMKLELNDMIIQLQNKNQNIDRLNDQLNAIKHEIALQQQAGNISAISKRNDSFDQQSNSLNRKDSRSDFKGEKDYSQISQQYSFGSLLGSSFVSFKSRASRSALQSAEGDCNCQFRYRYYEYKSLHQTLKNQLQIVKKQLQVAKDLNDHFQNQLKFYGDNPDREEVEKIKNSIKEAQKQRDSLRQKYIKYKDYSNALKTDFKKKMQAIYRKLKRQT